MSILRTRTLSKRAFQFNVKPTASRRIFTPAAQSATILLADVPIEEERIFGYDPRRFLPVNPGDLLNNKYEIVTKLGWGTTSTVWLARDTQRETRANNHSTFDEKPITRRLLLCEDDYDNFEVQGSDGPHLCLVYEPMREPLWLNQQRWQGRLPPAILKVYLRLLLRGLDYLHSEGSIIHTDLLDNILMGFEDPSVLEDFVHKRAKNPMPRKIKDARSIYLSHNDFGPPKSFRILPKIADFGLAQSGEGSEPLMHPIPPALFHAPEVLLG